MKTPEGGPIESPILKLTENREVIEKKLEEYKSRLDEFIPPEAQLDTIYKIAVAQKLVDTGEVNTHDLSREIVEKYGSIDTRFFDNACGVISDYLVTGGKNVQGGTGLNKEPINEDDNDGGRIM